MYLYICTLTFTVKIKSYVLFRSVLSPYPLPRSHSPLLPCNWSWSCFSFRPMNFSQFVDLPIPLVRTYISTVSVPDDSDSPLFQLFFLYDYIFCHINFITYTQEHIMFFIQQTIYIIKEKPETWFSMDYILPPSDRHSAMWIRSGGPEEQQWVVKCRFLRGVPWGVLLTADINNM